MSKKIYNELPFSERLKLLNEIKNGVSQRALADKYKISKGQVCKKRKEVIIILVVQIQSYEGIDLKLENLLY